MRTHLRIFVIFAQTRRFVLARIKPWHATRITCADFYFEKWKYKNEEQKLKSHFELKTDKIIMQNCK